MSDPFDQLSLFAPHVARAEEGRALLLDLQFTDAARILGDAGADTHARLAERLAEVKGGRGPLAAFERLRSCLDLPGLDAMPGLTEAIARGAAEALERVKKDGALFDDQPVADLWVRAGEPTRALASLAASVARHPERVDLAIRLGNERLRANDEAGAREAFLSALRADPLAAEIDSIADPKVLDLADDADELVPDDAGDPRYWLVALGLISGVFMMVPPEGAGDGMLPLTATPAERARAAADTIALSVRDRDPVPARRALQRLAPWLLDRWLGSGRA